MTVGPDPAASLAELPASGGCYALIFDLPAPLDLAAVGRLGTVHLKASVHIYAGNANGPGGLRGRIRRHLSPGKKPHWHIDHLSAALRPKGVIAVPGGSECGLIETLAAGLDARSPVPGFGSSDCRRCAAHLVTCSESGLDGTMSFLASLPGAQAFEPSEFLRRSAKGGS